MHYSEGMKKSPGCLIFFEGADKSGKGTLWALACYALKERGYSVEGVTFPDYSNIHGLLVDLALRSEFANSIPEEVKALNYAVNRAYVTPTIKNSLEQGKIVVCKRSPLSNVAYRVGLKGADLDVVRGLDAYFPSANISLFLDIDEDVRKARTKNGQKADELERMNQNPVRDLYLRMHDAHDPEFSQKFPADFKFVLDASGSIQQNFERVMGTLDSVLENYVLSKQATLSFVGMQEPKSLERVYEMRIKELFSSYVARNPQKQEVNTLDELVCVSGIDIDPKPFFEKHAR